MTIDIDKAAESIAQMVTEWVDGGIQMGTNWRPGLHSIIARRLTRFADPAEHAVDDCDVPPAGWSCSRQKGHDGPCAASPVNEHQEPVGEVADMKYNRVQFYRATGDTSKPYLLPGTKLYTAPVAPDHSGDAAEMVLLTAVATLHDDGDGGLEPNWLLEGGTAELLEGMVLLVADNDQTLCDEAGHCELYRRAPDTVSVALLERRNADLSKVISIAKNALASANFLIKKHLPGNNWIPSLDRDMNAIKAILGISSEPEPDIEAPPPHVSPEAKALRKVMVACAEGQRLGHVSNIAEAALEAMPGPTNPFWPASSAEELAAFKDWLRNKECAPAAPKYCECPPGVRNITEGGHFPACTACHRRLK